MRIRTQIRAGIGLAGLAILVMAVASWFYEARLVEHSLIESRTREASRLVASLQLLTHEYFLYAEPRAAQQWWSQQRALVDLLRAGAGTRIAISAAALTATDQLAATFEQFVQAGRGDNEFSSRQKHFLADRILNGTQLIADAVRHWQTATDRHQQMLERHFRAMALSLPLLMMLILGFFGLLLSRRVLRPMRQIHQTVMAVANGDRSARCAYAVEDEFGDLSRTFDAMAVDLVAELRREVEERRQAERILQESEARFRLLLDNAPDAIFVQTGGCFSFLNQTAVQLFGADSTQALIGTPVLDRVYPDLRESVRERIQQLNQQRATVPLLHEIMLRMDGSTVDVEVSAVPMTYDGEDGALVFMRDITERLEADRTRQDLQEQLHQIQKVESVGRLAGGVAHDYNNMLSVIIGFTELAQRKSAADDPLQEYLQQILKAALRSRDITQQLLAFARKQNIEPRVLDLNATVENLLKMLRHLLGENIELVWLPARDLWPVEMDPSLLDQVLANLCVNARDAISDVGKMTIETGQARIDEDYCRDHAGFQPGEFVVLMVSDNGCGMDKAVQDRIFEPFFTTKPAGAGTGLGLATVYGVVKQSHGFINVYSEPGKGTTFKIYLPRHCGIPVAETEVVTSEPLTGRGETVLVVEDEPAILSLIETMLTELGYQVLTAGSPATALKLAEGCLESIELLLTDVVMPEMNGRELSNRLRAGCPRLKTLYMSGYTANVIAHHGVLEKELHFIHKPFSRLELGSQVRKALMAEI